MKLKKSESNNQNITSTLRTVLARVVITLTAYIIGYSSIIVSQKIFFPSHENKANASFNLLQDDTPFSIDLIRPSYPSQVYNRKTKKWEVMNSDKSKFQTESEPLPDPPIVQIEQK